MNKLYKYITSPRRSTRDLGMNIFITLLLAVVFTVINPNFVKGYNLVSMGQSLAPYAFMSLGILFPVSMGGIDLSVGAVCIGSAVLAGKFYELGMPLWCVIPVMMLFGLIIGLLNGTIIAKYNIQPFIVTLGTMMFVRGFTAIIAAEPTVLYPANCWYNQLFSNFNGFPMGIVWVLLFSFAVYFIFRKTKYGRYFISIGSNELSTRISGVDTEKYKCLGYALSGLMAGIAGIFWTASFATVTVATGNGMELDAVAGVYIGGTAALGGMANVWGTLIGAIMLVVVRSGLNFSLARLNISINSTYVTYVISGIIVVVAVLIERMRDGGIGKKKGKAGENGKVALKLVSAGLSVVMLVFLVLVSCGAINLDNTASKEEQKTICVLMKSEGVDFWDSVKEGAVDAGKENNYRIVCRGTESEDPSFLPKQLEIAESLLSEKPVGIALATIADGFTDYLAKLKDNGIPAIQFDSGLYQKDVEAVTEAGKNPLVAYVKADTYANSALAAEKTFEAIKDDIAAADEYIIGIIQHENSETATLRAKGFEDKIKELAEADPQTQGKVTVITEIKPSQMNNAYMDALNFLYEKNARTVFGTNLLVSQQVFDAIQAAGNKYDGMKFAAYDTGDKVFEWMKNDYKAELIGAVDQNPYMIGKLTVETIAKISNGEQIDEEVIVPGIWYDKTNAK